MYKEIGGAVCILAHFSEDSVKEGHMNEPAIFRINRARTGRKFNLIDMYFIPTLSNWNNNLCDPMKNQLASTFCGIHIRVRNIQQD